MPTPLHHIHLGSSALQAFKVTFLSDGPRYDLAQAAADAIFRQTSSDSVFDYLTDGAQFITDRLGFAYQCVENDVCFPLLIQKVPAAKDRKSTRLNSRHLG